MSYPGQEELRPHGKPSAVHAFQGKARFLNGYSQAIL